MESHHSSLSGKIGRHMFTIGKTFSYLIGLLLLATLLAACGGKSNRSSTVTPPTPVSTTSADIGKMTVTDNSISGKLVNDEWHFLTQFGKVSFDPQTKTVCVENTNACKSNTYYSAPSTKGQTSVIVIELDGGDNPLNFIVYENGLTVELFAFDFNSVKSPGRVLKATDRTIFVPIQLWA